MAKKTSTQSAKQRSACLKFVKKYKSLTVELKGPARLSSLGSMINFFFSAA